ncbi:MAG: alpha/beta hydrolase [Deltaproteobacteria bacterium]|nr:alpha/beta hydrolase [Deltaproteobacteria bacterium]
MKTEGFTFCGQGETEISVCKWSPDIVADRKAAVILVHGMAETAARYERFAAALTAAGFAVYALDLRGHGRTAKRAENMGYLGQGDGFEMMLGDLRHLHGMVREENRQDLPLFLFGHSMGSFLVQGYVSRYGKELKGVVLSGTAGKFGWLLYPALAIAAVEMKIRGRRARSRLLNRIIFGGFNRQFRPNRTAFDWLTSDAAEVDRFINDPYCGYTFSTSFFRDFFLFLLKIHTVESLGAIPRDLPVYIFSGDRDPVGRNTKSVLQLIRMYREAGLRDVTSTFYRGGRHEMLHEVNREEVANDILCWLHEHC